jgi:hypothetical protein
MIESDIVERIAAMVEAEALGWEHLPMVESAIAGVAAKIRSGDWKPRCSSCSKPGCVPNESCRMGSDLRVYRCRYLCRLAILLQMLELEREAADTDVKLNRLFVDPVKRRLSILGAPA